MNGSNESKIIEVHQMTSEDFDKLINYEYEGLDSEVRKECKSMLEELSTPYMLKERDNFDGPRSMDADFSLEEDFYSYTYVYYVKFNYLFGEEQPDNKTPPEEEK